MTRIVACLLLLLGSACLARAEDDDPEPPGAPDGKKLQGTWDVVKALKGGKDDTQELKNRGAYLVIEKNKFTFHEGRGGQPENMTVTFDARKRPAHMDVRNPRGRETVRAIYKLEKGRLSIAFDEGDERPKSFDKAGGLLVLERRVEKK